MDADEVGKKNVGETFASRNRVALRCARNIAQWWMLEHYKITRGSVRVSSPGGLAMQSALSGATVYIRALCSDTLKNDLELQALVVVV